MRRCNAPKARFISSSFRLRIVAGFSALIIIFLVVMIMVTMGGIPGTDNRGRFESYREDTFSRLGLASSLLSEHMTRWSLELRATVQGLAGAPVFSDAIISSIAGGARPDRFDRDLAACFLPHPEIAAAAVIDVKKGARLGSYGKFSVAGGSEQLGIDDDKRGKLETPGYEEELSLYQPAAKELRLRIIRQITKPADSGEAFALLIVDVDMIKCLNQQIWSMNADLFREWRCLISVPLNDGALMVFRSDGVELVRPGGKAGGLAGFVPFARALSGLEGPWDGMDESGTLILAYHRDIRIAHDILFALVVEADKKNALAKAQSEILYQSLLWIFLLVAGVGFGIVLSNQIAQPLTAFAETAQKIGEGDLSARAKEDDTEIGKLARVFNSMAEHVESSQKELERQVRELAVARDAAESSNRAKSVFLANMSHELRTPLNAILGFTGIMVRATKQDSLDRERLNIILRSGEHLLSVINDILDLAKIESGRLTAESKTFDLGNLTVDLIAMLKVKAEAKGLRLEVDQSSSFPRFIKTDQAKLRQVIINLVGNAIKFTDEGFVRMKLCTLNDRDQQDRHRLLVEITDSGRGIDEADLKRIFQPFVQAGEHEGTGLGLTITRRYVELLGGELGVKSVLGNGSTFSFTVSYEPADESELPPALQTAIPTFENAADFRILVVEDQEENRLVLRALLEPSGFKIIEAENGRLGVESWRGKRPQLIFMDRRMPELDGIGAVREIRAAGDKTTPIIAVTAHAFKEEQDEMIAAGCNDFVAKPFSAPELFAALERALPLRRKKAEELKAKLEDNAAPSAADFARLPEPLLKKLLAALDGAYMVDIDKLVAEAAALDPQTGEWLAKRARIFDYEGMTAALRDKGDTTG